MNPIMTIDVEEGPNARRILDFLLTLTANNKDGNIKITIHEKDTALSTKLERRGITGRRA